MKIGFLTHPRKDILKEIEWIGENGFDFVDLFLEEDKGTPEAVDVAAVRRQLRKYRLSAVGHTGWYLPIGHPMKAIRQAAVKEAARYFRLCGRLGVRYVTVHGNWPFRMFTEDEAVRFQVETLRAMVKEARKHGVVVMYEHTGSPRETLENIGRILRGVPGLAFHLDIGHANLNGHTPVQFIRKFGRRIRHVHLHDNKGKGDDHLPMGKGTVDWKKTINELRKVYDGTVTLEIFSGKEDVLASREKLRKLLRQP